MMNLCLSQIRDKEDWIEVCAGTIIIRCPVCEEMMHKPTAIPKSVRIPAQVEERWAY